jgi:hypothetical protein
VGADLSAALDLKIKAHDAGVGGVLSDDPVQIPGLDGVDLALVELLSGGEWGHLGSS